MKNKKVVIFGVLDTAELAHYYLTHDSEYEVVAFTVNKEYLKNQTFSPRGTDEIYPVVEFEKLEEQYPPSDYLLFAPMTGVKMNNLRKKIYEEGKAKGYSYISYVSSKATVCNNKIGDNCFILEDNTLQPFTEIGNNVVMWSGNHIGHHGKIEDHVFFYGSWPVLTSNSDSSRKTTSDAPLQPPKRRPGVDIPTIIIINLFKPTNIKLLEI